MTGLYNLLTAVDIYRKTWKRFAMSPLSMSRQTSALLSVKAPSMLDARKIAYQQRPGVHAQVPCR